MDDWNMENMVKEFCREIHLYRSEYSKDFNSFQRGDYTVDIQRVVAVLDFLDEIEIAIEKSYRRLVDYK